MALWRTSAAVAALLLVATACGQTSDSDEAASRTTVASRPQLAPVGQTPLTVKGTGFQPNEKVQVGAKGTVKGSSTATTAADSSGTFVVRLPG